MPEDNKILSRFDLDKGDVRRITGYPIFEIKNKNPTPCPDAHVSWGGKINSCIYFRASARRWFKENGFKIDKKTRFKVFYQADNGADLFMDFSKKEGFKLLFHKGSNGLDTKLISTSFYSKMRGRRCFNLSIGKQHDIRLRCVWKE